MDSSQVTLPTDGSSTWILRVEVKSFGVRKQDAHPAVW
jgi:hypothetical protein